MIPFDFDYYRPDTIDEISKIFTDLMSQHKSPVFYGGGTELISMARAGSIIFDSVIDLKNVPECNVIELDKNDLIIGSAVTLTKIKESGYFPLLGETVSRIADHTIQDKITIGGNIAGTIIYREAVLPLLLTNSRVKILGNNGEIKTEDFSSVFSDRLHLKNGEIIVQLLIDQSYLKLPYNHVKKTKIDKIDYPLISFAAIKKGYTIRAAVSGLTANPYLLQEDTLNDLNTPELKRIDNLIDDIQDNILNDLSGSKEYRIFVFTSILQQMYANFREEV